MNTLSQGYGARVRAAREDMNMGMQAFARNALSTGASAVNIGRVEREQVVPRDTTLERIGRYAKVSPKWLADGKVKFSAMDPVRLPGVGARIMQARQQKHMSQLSLAKRAKLGETATNIGRLEKNIHRPRLSTVKRIAKVLGMPWRQLAYGV